MSPRFLPMASEGAADISAEYRESSTEQPDTSLAYEQAIVLTDATSKKDAGSDDENASEDTGDNEMFPIMVVT
jgi:hypothetical protein